MEKGRLVLPWAEVIPRLKRVLLRPPVACSFPPPSAPYCREFLCRYVGPEGFQVQPVVPSAQRNYLENPNAQVHPRQMNLESLGSDPADSMSSQGRESLLQVVVDE